MKLIILLVTGLLAGCAHTKPVLVRVPKDVNVSVRVKCIDKKDLPPAQEWPLDSVNLSDKEEALPRAVHAARLERKQRIEYVKLAEEIFKKCSE